MIENVILANILWNCEISATDIFMIKNMVFPTPEAWKSLWILKTY